jgi:xylan 1,4-beta-xylosidase
MADVQRQLAMVTSECGFKYLRFHGLLHDDMGVVRLDDAGLIRYDWQYIDLLFDAILSLDVRPFVELGFMPSALASGSETIFWWKGNVTLPRSAELWTDLIRELTRHWTDRYGADEVCRWYFEVWNEPNLTGFFAATQADYFTLYAETAKTIKSIDARYRVGGPATAGCAWIPEFIAWCHEGDVPLDFISTHTYGVNGYLDEWGVQKTVLESDPDSVTRDVRAVASQVHESAMPNLPIHFTEWSTSYTPRDPVHDSYHSAAWILSKLKNCERLTSSMSYWTFTDIFEEPGPPTDPFHGGFGLVNTQGVRKPAFFAYKYLNRLGPRELECVNADAWVCASDSGTQVLLWNVTPSGTAEPNQEYYRRDLPSTLAERVSIEIAGYASGRYTLSTYRVGYRKNDVYTAFLGMKVDRSLNHAQVADLHEASADKPVIDTINVTDGCLRWTIELETNEAVLLEITRES